MACPAVITGDQFVTRVLTHVDCQAQYLGSYGYQSLADPGSLAAVVMSSLLTLFIALWGLRLLLGPVPDARDVMIDVLKIGIVLTLAFSWPAFRTVVHDVVLDGPAQIASSISTPGLSDSGAQFVERLQAVDNAIVSLIETGTGRRSGQFIDETQAGGTFQGTALEDQSAMGWGRLSFLVGMIGSLTLLRIAAGLLLALAPLAAGLLLFEATRGVFAGWVRGLVFVIASAIAVTFTLGIELVMLEPWLADALQVRALGYATPSAPIELLAITMAFTLVHLAIIWVMARVTFHGGWLAGAVTRFVDQSGKTEGLPSRRSGAESVVRQTRAESIASHIETRMRMEQRAGYSARVPSPRTLSEPETTGSGHRTFGGAPVPAGVGSHRRTSRSASLSAARRDLGQ